MSLFPSVPEAMNTLLLDGLLADLFAHDQILGKSEPNPLDHRPCVCPTRCNHRALHVGWTLGLKGLDDFTHIF